MTRDFSRPGANVGAVLGEHRPVGERRDRHEMLRELDPHRPRRVEAVAKFRLAARSFLDLRMPMAEHDRAVRAHVVDVLVAIDVPDVRALAARKKRRVRALGEHQRRLMSVDSAGDNFLRALHQRVTFLECVGFHGNSCAMIFAARQVGSLSRADRQRESYLQARGSSLQKKRGRESLQLTARPHPNMRLILPSDDMPGRSAAATAVVHRRGPAHRAAWRARAACTAPRMRRADSSRQCRGRRASW